MERLTLEHVLGLIEREEYVVNEQYVQCVLHIGEAPVIGTSYRFSKATHDPDQAKKAARDDAIRQLFSLEAYHQKRIRPKVISPFQEPVGENSVVVHLGFADHYVGMQEAVKGMVRAVDTGDNNSVEDSLFGQRNKTL